jgi:FixJ family two-component response regulator
MTKARPLVSVVDDDESVREALPSLLKEVGFPSQTFSSAEEFLASGEVSQTQCLILDIAMPGMSGRDLQQLLKQRQVRIPIIFLTANGDAVVRRQLLARGAADFLLKPFTDTALLDALNLALQNE